MRKLLLDLLLIILIVGAVFIVVKGVNTDVITISSFADIGDENQSLDDTIEEANNQKDGNYKKQKNSLDSAYKTLISEKESYQELLDLGVDKDGVPLSKIQEYEIEKIWIAVGGYAEKEGVDLKFDISVNNTTSKTYDLNFTVIGMYSSIVEFIRDVQSDNTLVFKIENFKLVSADEEDMLKATFVCKDIKINIEDDTTKDENNNKNNNTSSTTNSTTTTTTENTKKTTENTKNTTETTKK